MDYGAPFVASYGAFRRLGLAADVDGDVLRHDALFDVACLRVSATTEEEARRFHTVVADLDFVAIYESKAILLLDLVLFFLLLLFFLFSARLLLFLTLL